MLCRMSVTVSDDPVVVSTARPVALSSLFNVTPSSSDPAYLVLTAFDRNEYTSDASDATGTLVGNGASVGLAPGGGDTRETGLVFTYQASTGRYYNATLGALDQLTYIASSSAGDITDLSLFATSSLAIATRYATDTYALMEVDAAGFLGTATVATLPGFQGGVPAQATPNSIAAVADSFVGQAWNENGCWTLTSTIAAEAGASLPVQSTVNIAGVTNGEWFVAFNGPNGATGDWRSMVRTGDMIGFVTGAGGGHITTCVGGSGSSAVLVDNETWVDQYGNILNPANDGSASDIIVEPAHAASEEWAGVDASSVVIYRLDTPLVTTTTGLLSLSAGAVAGLAGLFTASDPAGKPVTEYQVFLGNPNDALVVNGAIVTPTSSSNAATVASLSSVSLEAGQGGGQEQVIVRAFNGAYWGDWTSLRVVSTAAPPQIPTPSATPTPTPTVTANVATTTTVITAATPTPTQTPTPTPGAATVTPTIASATAPISSSTVLPVYRFFDMTDGTHFFTASASECANLIATRPDLTNEGVGMNAVGSPASDPAAEAVYRFFDAANGTHFFTADIAERNGLIAGDPAMTYEGVAFYEDTTPTAGDSPVYRFFDSKHGTHLYTESAAEQATIQATRPDLKSEGIAFYAPTLS